MNEIINIKSQNGKAVVSSREVAEHFGKRHSEVIRAIEKKLEVNAILRSPKYFIETTYLDKSNRQTKEYLMTRDGFSFIVMGFTGKEADEWKLKYIEAFNKMEASLKEIPSVAYLNGCANLINTLRRIMKAQGSSPYKIALQTKLLCQSYGIPIIDEFIEPAFEQILIWD